MNVKIISVCMLIFCFVFFMPINAAAEGNEMDVSQSEQMQQFGDEISDGVKSAADDDVNEILEQYDISTDNPQGVNNISIGSVLEKIVSMFAEAVKSPLIMLGKIIAITLLCTIAQSMAPEGSSLISALKTISVLSAVAVIYGTVSSNIQTVESSLERISEFMMSYVPIFSSVTAVGGSITSSGSYYAMTLMACEVIGVISNKVIMPFLSIVMAISIVSSVNPNLRFGGAAESIKKACQWILRGVTTLFVGLLSIQGLTGTATDSLVTRTAKFAASSFIPIIGGAVSEAYSTLYSSLGIIRTGVGSIGIIAVVVMVLPPIVSIIAAKFAISMANIISDIFDQRECSDLLKSTNAVLSICLSVVFCFSLIFIISTAVLMLMAMNISI